VPSTNQGALVQCERIVGLAQTFCPTLLPEGLRGKRGGLRTCVLESSLRGGWKACSHLIQVWTRGWQGDGPHAIRPVYPCTPMTAAEWLLFNEISNVFLTDRCCSRLAFRCRPPSGFPVRFAPFEGPGAHIDTFGADLLLFPFEILPRPLTAF
jgi:hypothetical protein